MAHIVLYTRIGCHLCDDAKAALERLRGHAPFDLTVIDVDTDAQAVALYGLEVPVVLLDGKKVAKFHVDRAPAAAHVVKLAYIAYATAALLTVLLVGMFVSALPEAIHRAREGDRRGRELACDALMATAANPMLGQLPAPAPDFALKDYAGREVRLSDLRGNVVLVNFWATWCPPCVAEVPSMERLAANMKGKPFRLLAVSVDDDWQTVRRFFAKGTVLDVLLDSSRETPKRWGTEKFPESFLIDPQGDVRYYVISDRDWSQPDIASCIESMTEQ